MPAIQETKQDIRSIIAEGKNNSPVSVTEQLEQAHNPVSQTQVVPVEGKTNTLFSLIGSQVKKSNSATTEAALPSNLRLQSTTQDVESLLRATNTGSDGTMTAVKTMPSGETDWVGDGGNPPNDDHTR